MANDHLVVLVHGLFGWGPDEALQFPYWRIARLVPSPLTKHEASVGPISSTHDRACELAFQIKGGQVDYGAQHAAAEGHARFGRTYATGMHPGWSAARPVHLVGHSMGGPTIWMLQHLLAIDFFGWGSSAEWVASISSISGVLNGSTATYFFGCDEETGLIRPASAGAVLARAIELHVRATGDLLDRFYDFDLDHWGLHATRGVPLALYVQHVATSPMFRGRDNGAYSLTIQALLEQNAGCATHPGTYYFSYVTEQTVRGLLTGHHYPEVTMNPLLLAPAVYIGHRTFDRPFYPGFRAEDWWHNDGLVPVYSQMFPRIAGHHPVGGEIGARRTFEPGRWYHTLLESMDHVDIVAIPQLDHVGVQRRFYTALFERLAGL